MRSYKKRQKKIS